LILNFIKIKDVLKLQILVVECYICLRKKIEKFFENIISIYTGVSNRYNVRNIIAKSIRVSLL